jgi:hypothetical protein
MRITVTHGRRWLFAGLFALASIVAGCGGGGGTGDSGGSGSSSSSSGSGTGGTSGTATVSWVPPTDNTDGTPVGDLAGFRVYYGTSSESLTETIDVNGATTTTYVVTGLSKGTYYFAVTAISSDGLESVPSETASKTI